MKSGKIKSLFTGVVFLLSSAVIEDIQYTLIKIKKKNERKKTAHG